MAQPGYFYVANVLCGACEGAAVSGSGADPWLKVGPELAAYFRSLVPGA